MKRAGMWTDVDVEILRACYAPGGGDMSAAIAKLPHRTPGAIGFKAWQLKLSSRGAIQRAPRKPRVKGRRPRAVPFPDAKAKILVREGECDRGDREFLRRRMPFIFVELAKELRRTPGAVRRAMIALANDGFRPDRIASISIDREEAAAVSLGTSVAAKKIDVPPRPVG